MHHVPVYLFAFALVSGAASGCTRKAEGRSMSISCQISGEAHLEAPLTGQQVCEHFSSELRAQLASDPQAEASVSVTVRSPYQAKAVLTVKQDGMSHTYPEQSVFTSDRALNERAIAMLVKGTLSPLRDAAR